MTPDQERRIRRNVDSGWEVSGIYVEDVTLLLAEIDRLRQVCKAAPDLLAAATALLNAIDMVTPHEFMRGRLAPECDRLEAAIKKAEGQS